MVRYHQFADKLNVGGCGTPRTPPPLATPLSFGLLFSQLASAACFSVFDPSILCIMGLQCLRLDSGGAFGSSISASKDKSPLSQLCHDTIILITEIFLQPLLEVLLLVRALWFDVSIYDILVRK